MHAIATISGSALAGIAWDPTIRGILSVAVGVAVLMGSVYLLLATNAGSRLGFLLAATAFFGWMAIMGAMWWMYGIGMKGEEPTWQVVEYTVGDPSQSGIEPVRDLDLSPLPEDNEGIDYEAVSELAEEDPGAFAALVAQVDERSDGWQLVAPSAAVHNEAQAAVAAALPECDTCTFGIDGENEFGAQDYMTLAALERGGKEALPEDANRWDRIYRWFRNALNLTHPPHHAVLQIQKVIPQEVDPGEAPPLPEVDPDEPVINVVLLRDLGDVRFPAAMITIGSTTIFLLLCWVLHRRERLLEDNLAHAEALAAGSA